MVVLKLDQCIVPDDSRFPKVKIHSTLPLVDFDIPEHRLMQLVNLIVTLPLPKADSGQTASQTDVSVIYLIQKMFERCFIKLVFV